MHTDAVVEPPKERTPEERWPSVAHAYTFVVPSYQFLVSRFEAADNRLTAFVTLASSLTLAAPLFAKAVRPAIEFARISFAVGMGCFFAAVLVAIGGRMYGGLDLPNPRLLYDKTLHFTTWEFQRHMVQFAGDAFENNVRVIRIKSNLATLVCGLLVAEITAFVLWIAR